MNRTRTGMPVTEHGRGDPRRSSQTAAAGVRAHGRTTVGATVPATNPQLPIAADALCCARHASPMRFDILIADIGIYGVLMTGYTCIYFCFWCLVPLCSCGMSCRQGLGVEEENGELQYFSKTALASRQRRHIHTHIPTHTHTHTHTTVDHSLIVCGACIRGNVCG